MTEAPLLPFNQFGRATAGPAIWSAGRSIKFSASQLWANNCDEAPRTENISPKIVRHPLRGRAHSTKSGFPTTPKPHHPGEDCTVQSSGQVGRFGIQSTTNLLRPYEIEDYRMGAGLAAWSAECIWLWLARPGVTLLVSLSSSSWRLSFSRQTALLFSYQLRASLQRSRAKSGEVRGAAANAK